MCYYINRKMAWGKAFSGQPTWTESKNDMGLRHVYSNNNNNIVIITILSSRKTL